MSLFKTSASIFLVALTLNLIWEFSHYRLYVDLSGIPSTPHLLLATFTDALIITGIFGILSLKNHGMKWIKRPSTLDYTLLIGLSLLIATGIEAINLNLERWAYTSQMPTFFGIGLSPLLQLAITAYLTLRILKRLPE